jgi:hypothetical protein
MGSVMVMGEEPEMAPVTGAQLDAELVRASDSALVPELAIDVTGAAMAHEIDWRPSVEATVQQPVY